ncbi:MAG: hypothetical protein H0V91_10740 [Flavisolibacter sp.]|jgi:hypothetical protein|nr:hypothetical protein [Flavisolibacter sp.]
MLYNDENAETSGHKPQVVEERIDPDYRKRRMQVFLAFSLVMQAITW